MTHPAPQFAGDMAAMIGLIHRDDLAKAVGYAGANSAFRDWCVRLRITPVPGRLGFYDLYLVRRRLDEAQGLFGRSETEGQSGGLVAQRRARIGAV